MPDLVGYLLLFTGVGAAFVLVNLTAGKFLRPAKMNPEKATIYECGEPTIGSAWVQFDLRFYVVALLFVIFDVEMAFFFPWAVVFGKANQLADPDLAADRRAALTAEMTAFDLDPATRRAAYDRMRAAYSPEELAKQQQEWEKDKAWYEARLAEPAWPESQRATWREDLKRHLANPPKAAPMDARKNADAARELARVAFVDILFFFGVLLVGFAYLWKRGDLDWVRSTAAQKAAARMEGLNGESRPREELVVLTKD